MEARHFKLAFGMGVLFLLKCVAVCGGQIPLDNVPSEYTENILLVLWGIRFKSIGNNIPHMCKHLSELLFLKCILWRLCYIEHNLISTKRQGIFQEQKNAHKRVLFFVFEMPISSLGFFLFKKMHVFCFCFFFFGFWGRSLPLVNALGGAGRAFPK